MTAVTFALSQPAPAALALPQPGARPAVAVGGRPGSASRLRPSPWGVAVMRVHPPYRMAVMRVRNSLPDSKPETTMTSKHHKWQTRWTVDHAARTATHESGLVVMMPGTEPRANNAAQVQQQLAAKHGHNAADMVARMLREAAALISGAPYGR